MNKQVLDFWKKEDYLMKKTRVSDTSKEKIENEKKYKEEFQLQDRNRSIEASKLELIKHNILALQKKTAESISDVQISYKNKLQAIYHIKSPKKTKHNSFDQSHYSKVDSLSKKFFIENHLKKQDLLEEYQQKSHQAVYVVKENLNLYWKTRINDLVDQLKKKENLSYELNQTEKEKIRLEHEKNMIERLAEAESKIYKELNETYKAEYMNDLEQLKINNKQKINASISALIQQIESDQYEIIKKEKTLWQEKLLQELDEKAVISQSPELKAEELRIRQQANEEIQETLDEVQNSIDQALILKFKLIDQEKPEKVKESIQKLIPDWEAEVKHEEGFTDNDQILSEIKSNIINKIKEDLRGKINSQVMLHKNKIYDDINAEFFQVHEEFRNKSEEKTRKIFENIERNFQENFLSFIHKHSEQKLKPMETKLRIIYHKKLEKIRESILNEITKKFNIQLKNFKRTVELEKISLCQFRANCNLLNKAVEKELKELSTQNLSNLKSISKKVSAPISFKSSRNISCEESQRQPCKPVKFHEKTQKPKLSNIKSSEILFLSKPLLPPSMNDENIKQKERNKKLKLISVSSTEDLYNTIITNQISILDSTKKPDINNKKIGLARSMSDTLKPKKSNYTQLLTKYHGSKKELKK